MRDDYNASPINPLPAVVWFLALPIIAMEAVIGLGQSGVTGGGEGWRLDAWQRFAFSPDLMRAMLETHTYPWQGMIRLVTYPLVHATFLHALMAVVILLALGKMVGEVFRPWAVAAVFLGAAVVGALAYAAIPGVRAPLIGAYPADYGLVGAFTFLIWTRLAATGSNQFRAFTLIGMLLGIQLFFGLFFGGGYDWVADLAGFATGFLLSFAVSPGGWARVMEKLRRR
ncbi:rhomboid family intramembrane serine protease [Rhodobacter sp. NSM]|uniref:rhomboid family intramembrane serine protease n=1 Tax=Rhodobacter sp. NSM TaxID=3457501 RepID=UPI003FD0E17A